MSGSTADTLRQIWWVNQGRTFGTESSGGFLWAPLADKRGSLPYHWANMRDVREGDLVLHYSQGSLVAVSEVVEAALEAQGPAGLGNEYSGRRGLLIKSKYYLLENPIELSWFNQEGTIRSIKQGPIDSNGSVKQGYLFRFCLDGLKTVVSLNKGAWPKVVESIVQATPRQGQRLDTVTTFKQIIDNVRRFHEETRKRDRSMGLPIRVKQYVAYDPVTGWFAPAKYAGFLGMTLDTYLNGVNNGFDGGRSHDGLDSVCKPPVDDPLVLARFREWLEEWGIPYKPNMTIYSAGKVENPPLLERFCQEIRGVKSSNQEGTPMHSTPLLILAAVRRLNQGQHLDYRPLSGDYIELARVLGFNVNSAVDPYRQLGVDGFWEILDGQGVHHSGEGTELTEVQLENSRALFVVGRDECITDTRLLPLVLEAIHSHFNDAQWSMLMASWTAKTAEEELNWEQLPLAVVAQEFSDALQASHLSFGQNHFGFVRTFLASLLTKRFVILTGLSGSGKTQIALQFGSWLGPGKSKIIPVRPDWTGPEALFGYEDALQPLVEGKRVWHVPEALGFMLQAASNPASLHLLVLDEMNLAHVERYFADVLSGMESNQPCLPNLQYKDGSWRLAEEACEKIPFPSNLLVVGTVNVDETTYMFSPKVLDRANTIEFRVASSDLHYTARRPILCMEGREASRKTLLQVAKDENWHLEYPHPETEIFTVLLRSLHHLLFQEGCEFGHRVFYEAVRFASFLGCLGEEDIYRALDLQIMQKVLPRLHGNRRRLEPVLQALSGFCLDPEGLAQAVRSQDESVTPSLPISYEKIHRMLRSLQANQYASFAE